MAESTNHTTSPSHRDKSKALGKATANPAALVPSYPGCLLQPAPRSSADGRSWQPSRQAAGEGWETKEGPFPHRGTFPCLKASRSLCLEAPVPSSPTSSRSGAHVPRGSHAHTPATRVESALLGEPQLPSRGGKPPKLNLGKVCLLPPSSRSKEAKNPPPFVRTPITESVTS